jgi:predicted GNAT family acetyltransferase
MTAALDDGLLVLDEPDRQRYVARLGDQVVGFTEYRARGERLTLYHTEVDPAFEGRGFGSRLASGILDDIRARGLKVTVSCPFIRAFVKRHPEYEDLRAGRPAGG